MWAAIDLMGGRAVTLVQGRPGEKKVWDESPIQLARKWREAGADGLHLVDLDAALGSGSNAGAARKIISESSIPVEIGGGVRSVEIADRWLEAGAARVVLGTLAFTDPAAARAVIDAHGPERVVAAADYRDGMVVTRGWRENQAVPVVAGAKRLESQGFRNLLTTDVTRDGMGLGPDVDTVRELSRATGMKIVASGGIRDVRDLLDLERAGADGAVLGKALYEGTLDIADARGRLA